MFAIQAANTQIGLALLDELIDEGYEFIDLNSFYFDDEEYEDDEE